MASKICSLAVLAWQFTLWTFAIKNVRNISLERAAFSALIPTLFLAILAILPYRL